jgi:2-polyprenyl-6-methoxyphenol hydroxylase-like FAD-dependent oxidoreductase
MKGMIANRSSLNAQPIGAMGLNTGFLDAVALSDALKMVLKDGKPGKLVLQMYSDERRKVVQDFIDPTPTYIKLRLHSINIETAQQDDRFFRCLQNYSSEDFTRYMRRFETIWPIIMGALANKDRDE